MASPALFPGRVKPQTLGLLSAAIPSPAGDAVGLLADAAGYAEDPKSLTLGSGLLSLAGMIPGVPSKKLVPGSSEWFDAMMPPPPSFSERVSAYFNNVNIPKILDSAPVSTQIFHGGPKRVTELSPEMSTNALTKILGRPTYFGTPSLDLAKSYGPKVSRLQVDMKNPLVVDMKGRDWQEAHSFINEFGPEMLEGKDGIIFKNVMDHGGGGISNGPIAHDVYALFPPPRKAAR